MYNLKGQRFSRLLVIEETARSKLVWKKHYVLWRCLCDCGSYTTVISKHLVGGNTKSCGCLQKEAIRKTGHNNFIGAGKSSFNALFQRYKKDAKRKKRGFSLTKEQFIEITSENCFYCGVEPFQVHTTQCNTGGHVYNGIDRVDSSKGYAESNCVPCCKQCNWMKLDTSQADFLSQIEKIYKNIHKNN